MAQSTVSKEEGVFGGGGRIRVERIWAESTEFDAEELGEWNNRAACEP